MKTVRTNIGPYAERPHFKLWEIDHMCTEALRLTGLYPERPEPIRIDRFIEKKFRVSPHYEHLPPGMLGYTKFGPNGVEEVVITAALDEEGNEAAERRVRSTLAHEGGHCLCHAHLFYLGTKPAALFDGEEGPPEILCRDVQGATAEARSYDGRWWEFQANRAIGGLLMPRGLVEQVLRSFTVPAGLLGTRRLDAAREEHAIAELAVIFNVNPIVARIRIEDLFPSTNAGQQFL